MLYIITNGMSINEEVLKNIVERYYDGSCYSIHNYKAIDSVLSLNDELLLNKQNEFLFTSDSNLSEVSKALVDKNINISAYVSFNNFSTYKPYCLGVLPFMHVDSVKQFSNKIIDDVDKYEEFKSKLHIDLEYTVINHILLSDKLDIKRYKYLSFITENDFEYANTVILKNFENVKNYTIINQDGVFIIFDSKEKPVFIEWI